MAILTVVFGGFEDILELVDCSLADLQHPDFQVAYFHLASQNFHSMAVVAGLHFHPLINWSLLNREGRLIWT